MDTALLEERRDGVDAGPSPGRERGWDLAVFAVVSVVLGVVVWYASRHVTDLYGQIDADYAGSSVVGGWYRFDGLWYDSITTDGYFWAGPDAQSSIAFFPAYPLLLWFLRVVTSLPVPLLGTLVTFASGAGTVVLFGDWCRDRLGTATGRLAVLALVLFPYAYYLVGAVYADALFLVAVVGAFVLLERDRPVLAGLVGIVATAGRPVGLALVVGLVAVLAERREIVRFEGWRPRIDLGRVRWRDSGVLLSLAGFAAWVGYLWVRFDAPLAFQQVQQAPGWDQGEGPHTWFKVVFLQRLTHLGEWFGGWLEAGTGPDPWRHLLYTVGVLCQGLLLLGFLALAVLVFRRLGWGYGLYTLAVLAIPLVATKDFQGVGRYLLAAFPCFAVGAGLLVDRPALRRTWLVASGALLVAWAFAFGRGYYVS